MSEDDKEVQEETAKGDPDKIIRNHVLAAMGICLIPVPLVDLAGLAGTQLNMMRKLAKMYGIPFSENLVKQLIGALAGTGFSLPIERIVGSIVKIIPVVGSTVGALAMPIAAGSSTYAVGKVFVQHFESGGTFLTFKPEKVRAYYQSLCKEGEKVAEEGA